jgi:hypothetical protein
MALHGDTIDHALRFLGTWELATRVQYTCRDWLAVCQAAIEDQSAVPGRSVILRGLSNTPELNGCVAVVVCPRDRSEGRALAARGRIKVRFTPPGGGGGEKEVAVRVRNVLARGRIVHPAAGAAMAALFLFTGLEGGGGDGGDGGDGGGGAGGAGGGDGGGGDGPPVRGDVRVGALDLVARCMSVATLRAAKSVGISQRGVPLAVSLEVRCHRCAPARAVVLDDEGCMLCALKELRGPVIRLECVSCSVQVGAEEGVGRDDAEQREFLARRYLEADDCLNMVQGMNMLM